MPGYQAHSGPQACFELCIKEKNENDAITACQYRQSISDPLSQPVTTKINIFCYFLSQYFYFRWDCYELHDNEDPNSECKVTKLDRKNHHKHFISEVWGPPILTPTLGVVTTVEWRDAGRGECVFFTTEVTSASSQGVFLCFFLLVLSSEMVSTV